MIKKRMSVTCKNKDLYIYKDTDLVKIYLLNRHMLIQICKNTEVLDTYKPVKIETYCFFQFICKNTDL